MDVRTKKARFPVGPVLERNVPPSASGCKGQECPMEVRTKKLMFTLFFFGDRKGTTKKLRDEDFAERSGELFGAICLKTLVLLGNDR